MEIECNALLLSLLVAEICAYISQVTHKHQSKAALIGLPAGQATYFLLGAVPCRVLTWLASTSSLSRQLGWLVTHKSK